MIEVQTLRLRSHAVEHILGASRYLHDVSRELIKGRNIEVPDILGSWSLSSIC